MNRLWIVSVAIVFLSGCAKPSGLTRSEFTAQSARIEIGDSEAKLLQLFPDAEAKGAKSTSKGNIKVFQVLYDKHGWMPDPGHAEDWGLDSKGYYGRIIWFYFWEGKLVQWGRPNDWPQNPDAIFEMRIK